MGMGKFRPPQLRNRLSDFDEIWTLELPSKDHPPRKISIRSDDGGWSRRIPSLPLLYPVYTIQPLIKPGCQTGCHVVKLVWQPVWQPCWTNRHCSFNRFSNRVDKRFDNRLYRVNGALGFCLCLSFFWSLHHVHRSHRWTDFHDLYVIWRLSTQGCAFWGSSWYCSSFRGLYPQKPIFGARIGVFKPNSQNRKTCILPKPLHRFKPNFAQW